MHRISQAQRLAGVFTSAFFVSRVVIRHRQVVEGHSVVGFELGCPGIVLDALLDLTKG